MKNKVIKEKAQALLKELQVSYSDAQIAVALERNAHTIWTWRTGRSTPCKGDYEMLKVLYNKSGEAT